MLSDGTTKVSKNRQVRRAIRRNSSSSEVDRTDRAAIDGARLTHSAKIGAVSHSKPNGTANTHDCGAIAMAPTARTARKHRAADHLPIEPADAQTRHSARLRSRGPFEKIAMRHVQSHQGPHQGIAHLPGVVGQKDNRQAALQSRQLQLRNEGLEVTAQRNSGSVRDHQEQRWAGTRVWRWWKAPADSPPAPAGIGNSQLEQSASSVTGATSERRRLSSILNRPISGTDCRRFDSPMIHGNSCQSPRVQRCWRLDATS